MAEKLYSPNTIRMIKEKYDFKFSKSLGQNFLIDGNIIDKIVTASEATLEDLIIEIGPGIGVLTARAAEMAKRVVAIEVDDELIPVLKDTLSDYNNIEIVHRDVLQTNINEIIERYITDYQIRNVKILGNLPYYITTPIIMKLLKDSVKADSITIMMQREVADRLCACPGTKAYGAISAAVQYYCTIDKITSVPKEAFMPRPKVDSTVIRLNIRSEKAVRTVNENTFFQCIKAGFGMRRKTISNSMMSVDGITKEILLASLEEAKVEPTRRAETLSLEEFGLIADEIERRRK